MATKIESTEWSFGAGYDSGGHYITFPITEFIRKFTGFAEGDVDDWKAVIYAWTGCKPSFIESTNVTVVGNEARIYYTVRANVTANYDGKGRGHVVWRRDTEVPSAGVPSGGTDQERGEGDRS